jgi:hypothetical protein
MNDVNAAQSVYDRLRLFSWLAALGGFIILVLIAIFMTVVLILALRVQDAATTVELQAQQSHNAICAIEANTVAQIRASTEFIAKNPNGLTDAQGNVILSRAEIDASLKRQRAFLDAIRSEIFCGGRS